MKAPHLPDVASLPDNPEALFEAAQEALFLRGECDLAIKALLADEDITNGVSHAKAIHEAKKTKMLLQYQYDLLMAKHNRLQLGLAES